MMLIDIGINLMNPAFDRDREAVIGRAAAAGVSPLIITGSSVESSAGAAGFAERYNRENAGSVYATAGVHPHNARHWKNETPGILRELLARDPVVAAGECGLDYNRNFSSPRDQRRCFEAQLLLAEECRLPLFLHERDAFEDLSSMIGSFRRGREGAVNMVIHCFTGTEGELETYLESGCYIGITGWIGDERRGARLLPLLEKIPPDRLLLETDAPYLLPRNMARRSPRSGGASRPGDGSGETPGPGPAGRSGRNESAYLVHIAEFAARILGKDPETLAAETRANTLRFFGLPAEVRPYDGVGTASF
ncbi:MAG: TatD family hydrolase [Treponema sp.]|jgi:TatD DNase family protein|nr:TatD family hydrolase [Treponema sp.]